MDRIPKLAATTALLSLLAACAGSPPPRPLRPDPERTTPVARAAAPAPFAAPTGEIALADALAAALAQSPALSAADADARAADARVLQASLLPNPELELEAEEFGGTGDRSGFGGAELSVGLAQEILLGGKIAGRTAVARGESRIAKIAYEAARSAVLAETAAAFVAVLAAQENLALKEEAADLATEVARAVTEQVEAGKVPRLEASRAAVAASLARLALERARRDLDVARRTLAGTWGAAQPSFDRARGDLYATGEAPALDALLARLDESPEVALAAALVEVRESGVALADADAWPDLAVGAGISRYQESGDHAFHAGISIPLPLFDRAQGERRAARAEAVGAREELRAARARAARELAAARDELVLAGAETRVLRDDVVLVAQDAFRAAKEGFAEGKVDYLVVLDAQRTLFLAKEELIGAAAAWHRAAADLERLVGRRLSSVKED